jgi:hypothetical protein
VPGALLFDLFLVILVVHCISDTILSMLHQDMKKSTMASKNVGASSQRSATLTHRAAMRRQQHGDLMLPVLSASGFWSTSMPLCMHGNMSLPMVPL